MKKKQNFFCHKNLAASIRISARHPCFDGHFPGHPVVPGVVLLDEILAILRPCLPPGIIPGLDVVKFLRPVAPDSEIAVEIAIAGDTARFSATVEGATVVTGTARLAPS